MAEHFTTATGGISFNSCDYDKDNNSNNNKNSQHTKFIQKIDQLSTIIKQNKNIRMDELAQIDTAINHFLKIQSNQNLKEYNKTSNLSLDSTSINSQNQTQTPSKNYKGNSNNKVPSSYACMYNYTMSDIKTTQELEQLSHQNDVLAKQLEQIMEIYQRQKLTLSNQAENILYVWLETHSTPQPPIMELFKDVIQELSKHMSVEQYINSIQSLESQQAINQMIRQEEPKNTSLIFDQTKQYVIQMAKIIYDQDQDQENAETFASTIFQ